MLYLLLLSILSRSYLLKQQQNFASNLLTEILPFLDGNINQYFVRMSTIQKETFRFIYKGVEYDASDYAEKHPGGLDFLQNMKAVAKDFTEYFRALHSDTAQRILRSFPIVSVKQPSKSSEEYLEIYGKVEPYFQPLWSIEILLTVLVASTWLIGCTTDYWWLSVICFAFSQILIGWIGHSAVHNRNPTLNILGRVESALLGGFSTEWWSPKHNMHHMFTNIVKYDEDIQHSYKVYLFEFLYLKWRFDSLVSAISKKSYLDTTLILLNYASLIYWSQNILYWVIAELLAGFYSAFVLIGNHEREKRYEQNLDVPFVDHQILTCRNYREENLFWLLLMGGMQFQTEHHLFPQIPFYRLPTTKSIIHKELSRLNKSMIYGPVI